MPNGAEDAYHKLRAMGEGRSVYVEKLTIRNFRCFEETELELNYPGRRSSPRHKAPNHLDNVNLFLGDNGSGKSAVFKAVSLVSLNYLTHSSGFKSDFLVRRFPSGSTNQDANSAVVTADFLLEPIEQASPLTNRSSVTESVEIRRRGDIEQVVTAEDTFSIAWLSDDSSTFFIAGYGASRRRERPEGYSETNRTVRYQRVAGLFEDHVGLVPFTYGYLQLLKRNRFAEARDTLNALMPDRVDLSEAVDEQDRPLFDVNGVLLPFNALSDGYRTFIGWVWDLLVQIARVQDDDKKLTDMPGVVIVDEIDLFLHPEWQRVVVEQVAKAFPKLQFLFSTHSPLVAGTLEPENIYVMETDHNGAAVVRQYQENIYGKTANQVLTSSYFGLASTRAPGTGTLSDMAARTLEQDPERTAARILEEIGAE